METKLEVVENALPEKINEVVIDSRFSGLTKAETIAQNYAPFMIEVTEQIEKFKVLKESDVLDIGALKRVRLDLGKIAVRTGDQKKTDKDDIIIEGRYIDALYNVVNGAARLTQGEVQELENREANIEKDRKEKLKESRIKQLAEFGASGEFMDLENMPVDAFDLHLKTVESGFIAALKAEKEAEEQRQAELKRIEEERIAKEKADKIERERIEKENAKLKKEAQVRKEKAAAEVKEREKLAKIESDKRAVRSEELTPYITFIRDYDKLISSSDADYKKDLNDIKRGANDHWNYERKKQEDEAKEGVRLRKEIAERKAKEDAERKKLQDENNRIAKELQDKKDAEAKKEAARLNKIELELKMGDSKKIRNLVMDLEALKTKYEFKSKNNKALYVNVGHLIDKTCAFIGEKQK